ncbi:MAG TPA: antibiotic biosynthesis monooxygenase family protein [Acidimicrobiia bacterium]|nr:antibiotic biosynthesis monooxygenase family protein [Acidimicrobiia bacterium]
MSKVSVVAKLTIKADKADEFPAAWDALLEHIDANEPGTEHYMLHRSSTEPNVFFVTEVYEDQAALDAHMGSGAFGAFGASLGDFVEGADMQFLAPVKAAKGQL